MGHGDECDLGMTGMKGMIETIGMSGMNGTWR